MKKFLFFFVFLMCVLLDYVGWNLFFANTYSKRSFKQCFNEGLKFWKEIA